MFKSKRYQILILELSDGQLISAIIPVTFRKRNNLSVNAIRATEPKKLPNGCILQKRFEGYVLQEVGLRREKIKAGQKEESCE